jgi:hypothetical protein
MEKSKVENTHSDKYYPIKAQKSVKSINMAAVIPTHTS